MQAKEPQCPLLTEQKTKHVGNIVLELFIILRVGYWYILCKWKVSLTLTLGAFN